MKEEEKEKVKRKVEMQMLKRERVIGVGTIREWAEGWVFLKVGCWSVNVKKSSKGVEDEMMQEIKVQG